MTEPRKSAPMAAKKTAAPAPAALGADSDHGPLLVGLQASISQLYAALADLRNDVATHSQVEDLHNKFDALKARADEAEKMLNSPAAKAARAIGKAWKGIG